MLTFERTCSTTPVAMSAEDPEEPSDDEESFDDEIFKPMHHPGKLRIDLQLRVPGEDVTSRRAKRENLDRFMWTCCGATGLDPGCEDGGTSGRELRTSILYLKITACPRTGTTSRNFPGTGRERATSTTTMRKGKNNRS